MTTGAGGISYIQQQPSRKLYERSLKNFIQHSALKRILVLVDNARTAVVGVPEPKEGVLILVLVEDGFGDLPVRCDLHNDEYLS